MTKKKHDPAPSKEASTAAAAEEPACGAATGDASAAPAVDEAGAAGDGSGAAAEAAEAAAGMSDAERYRELAAKKELEAKEHYSRLQYMAAEFDNFRRRTAKEKERLFSDATVEVVSAFLPVLDSLERAAATCPAGEECPPEARTLADGLALVTRQFRDALGKIGVTEIAAVGEKFDPERHNAVMHVDDDTHGDNEIVESFQTGYQYKDGAVVRHSMVKVAN